MGVFKLLQSGHIRRIGDVFVILHQIPEFLLRPDRAVSVPDLHAEAVFLCKVFGFNQPPSGIDVDIAPVSYTHLDVYKRQEERILEMTLLKYNGDKQQAMEELDMSRTVFYEKIKKYNIKY